MNYFAHFTAWRKKEMVHYNLELELEGENTLENALRVAKTINSKINKSYNVKRAKLKALHLDNKQVWPEENIDSVNPSEN